MSVGTFRRTSDHGRVTFIDGTPTTPLSLILGFDLGDLSLSGLTKVLNEMVKFERRGHFVDATVGARKYPTGSLTVALTDLTAASGTGSILDWFFGQGPYAAIKSTLGDGSTRPFTCDLKWEQFDADLDNPEAITLHDVYVTCDLAEAQDGNVVTLSFEVLGEIDGVLDADEIGAFQ